MKNFKNKIYGLIKNSNKRMKPSFLIIGAQKCGTTALFDYLSKHPNISAPKIKEIDFFGCETRFAKGFDFYHLHFPITDNYKDKLSFEASPHYIFSQKAAKRIYEYNPKMKLIAVLRNPVARAFSAWNMYKKRFKVGKLWFENWIKGCDGDAGINLWGPRNLEKFDSFDFAVKEELMALKKGQFLEAPLLLHGQYVEQIKRYFSFFKQEQVLLLENKRFKSSTVETLKEVENFLCISEHAWKKETVTPVFVGEYDSMISSETVTILEEYYKPYNERLFNLIGKTYDW